MPSTRCWAAHWTERRTARSPIASDAWLGPLVPLCAAASGLAVATLGYLRSRSALGHLTVAAATVMTMFLAGWVITAARTDQTDEFPLLGALLVIATGATWLAASLRGLFAERVVGQFVGLIAIFVGTQGLRDGVGPDWLVPVLVLVEGLLLMAAYGWLRQWPLLVGGVGGVIIGGTELLVAYTEGFVAAVGSLLLGLAMLGAGLRLLRERRPSG